MLSVCSLDKHCVMHRYGEPDVQSHTQNPSSLILMEELECMKGEKRDMMFPRRREGSESREEVRVQGKRQGDFHGTAEG